MRSFNQPIEFGCLIISHCSFRNYYKITTRGLHGWGSGRVLTPLICDLAAAQEFFSDSLSTSLAESKISRSIHWVSERISKTSVSHLHKTHRMLRFQFFLGKTTSIYHPISKLIVKKLARSNLALGKRSTVG